jgi:ACS family tartrate transporter-like MFS transporter
MGERPNGAFVSGDQVFGKCAWRLIPFMLLLYIVNYLDRVNVGFAALTMNRDLGFSPEIFGFGAGIFFFSYALAQVPFGVVLERVGAKRAVFCIMLAWGLLSAATALVKSPASFYAVRFLLGVAEAGFFPGMLFYLTLWFPQAHRARFTALFVTGIPLASIIGGPLSGLILGLDGFGGLHGWQILFLLEGIPAALLGFAVLEYLPDRPATAPFLSREEKDAIALSLGGDGAAKEHHLWPALRDPRVLALGVVGMGNGAALYGSGVWLPQMIKAAGFSDLQTGFVVALPYAAAAAAMILWGRSSDRRGERIGHSAVALLVGAAGFAAASLAPSGPLMVLALTFAVVGTLSYFGPFFAFPSSFLRGPAAAGGIALVAAMANFGGFLGPTLIGMIRQRTGGYADAMLALAAGLALSAAIILLLGRAMAARKVQTA